MTSEYCTPQARALRKHTSQLTRAIHETDLPALAVGLFSEAIISTDLMESVCNPATAARTVRCSKLLVAVMAYLEDYPDKLECVLKILNQEPTLCTIAENIAKDCEIEEASGSTHPHKAAVPSEALSPTLGRYSAHLKKRYRRTKRPFNCKWPPSPCEEIVKLAAVKKRKRKTREKEVSSMRSNSLEEYIKEEELVPVQMDEILKGDDNDSPPNCVIVQGAPGIGKSTFAWNLSQKWAEGSLYQEFNLVILLQMRDPRVREAKSLSDLINYYDNKAVVQEILERGGKGVLLLFEGIDELPAACLDEGSIFMDLFRGVLLPEATILATTRPWAGEKLKQTCSEQISKEIELLGFEKEDIRHYSSLSFEGEVDRAEFHQHVLSHPLLETVMYIPLNAAIVVQVYKQRKSSAQPPPQTMTQLYKSLIQGLVIRYLRDDPRFKELNLNRLEELPPALWEQFCKLCELARSAFGKSSIKMVFPGSELPLDSLGIMQTTSDLSADVGSVLLHSFPHITVQEFLAAYHISLLPLEEQAAFVFEHQSLPQFQVILGFLFGLSKHINALWPYLKPLSLDVNTNVHYFCWLYEAQSPELCAAYLGTDPIAFSCTKHSSLDFFVMTYCMAYSNCQWAVSIYNLPSTAVAFHPPNDTLACFQGSICTLYVEFIDLKMSKLSEILSLPTRLLAGIRNLYLRQCLCEKSCELLSNLVAANIFLKLEILAIRCTIDNIAGLLRALSFTNTPQVLQISDFNEISNTSITQLSNLVYSSASLSYFYLQNVHLNDSQDLQLLFSAMARPSSLIQLCFHEVALSSTDVQYLAVVLSQHSKLTELSLYECSVDDEGASHLAAALEVNTTLKYLRFRNKITKAGAQVLADMLKINSTLQQVCVLDRSIGIDGAIKFITALEENKTVVELTLHEDCHPPELVYVDRVKYI